MNKLTLMGNPIAKARPRFNRTGKTYDCQWREKKDAKIELLSQFTKDGGISVSKAPIAVQMIFHTPIPRSTPRKAANALEGYPNVKRPDVDNYAKFYLDVMNGMVYEDDNQIFDLWCEKRYSAKPRVEIFIKERMDTMINEHAATVKETITVEELDYMVKKANRLGLRDRQLVRVFMEEDNEGKHYYFECESPKCKQEQ